MNILELDQDPVTYPLHLLMAMDSTLGGKPGSPKGLGAVSWPTPEGKVNRCARLFGASSGVKGSCLFVMRPHSNDLYGVDVIQDLVDQPMLDIDPPRAGASEVSYQFLVCRRGSIGVFSENLEQSFRLGLKAGLGELPCIFLGLLGKHQSPAHHSSSASHCSTGVSSPLRMDSRIPGRDARYRVS